MHTWGYIVTGAEGSLDEDKVARERERERQRGKERASREKEKEKRNRGEEGEESCTKSVNNTKADCGRGWQNSKKLRLYIKGFTALRAMCLLSFLSLSLSSWRERGEEAKTYGEDESVRADGLGREEQILRQTRRRARALYCRAAAERRLVASFPSYSLSLSLSLLLSMSQYVSFSFSLALVVNGRRSWRGELNVVWRMKETILHIVSGRSYTVRERARDEGRCVRQIRRARVLILFFSVFLKFYSCGWLLGRWAGCCCRCWYVACKRLCSWVCDSEYFRNVMSLNSTMRVFNVCFTKRVYIIFHGDRWKSWK